MFKGRQLQGLALASAMAMGSAGCFGNKNADVAVAPPPPPAAYPDTSAISSGTGTPPPSVPGSATLAATNRSSAPAAPAPFQLREGEQLVTHQIQSGENLSGIAAKYNTSVGRIQSANGMTSTKIIAGKTLQVPTSAPPTHLAQSGAAAPLPANERYGSPAPSAPSYTAPAAGGYPGTTAPPVVPSVPTVPSVPATNSGAIAAPPVPPGASAPTTPSATLPGYPASTSYPRTDGTAGTYPTPSFEGSRIQFSN